MDFAAFRAALIAGGLESDGTTLTTPYTVAFPSSGPFQWKQGAQALIDAAVETNANRAALTEDAGSHIMTLPGLSRFSPSPPSRAGRPPTCRTPQPPRFST